MIRSIITDIEGTTTPISFVHRVLFPYARERLQNFVDNNPDYPSLAAVPEPKLETLLKWMELDEKITALKTIQGEIWKQGFADKHLVGEVYDDVPPALSKWSEAGLRLFVFSSGSVNAQKLLFGHTAYGDLTPKFEGFFDTNIGSKKQSGSYTDIIRIIGTQPNETLFLSDIEAELDAAALAGLKVCQLVRPEDKTQTSSHHPVAADFYNVSSLFGLPRE
ncbi:MAG: acireductone synthase [Rhodospirillales bacterium]|nr:acireductone synthase [Rhodospirillales bacterium]